MAAYAALVSLRHIIKQIENHPFPPISVPKKHFESLTKNVTFFQEFLEGYAPTGKNEGDGLQSRILDAAYAAEDVIESHIADRILAGPTSHADQVELGQLLEKVIQDMDLIKNEVKETKMKMRVQHPLQRKSTSSSNVQKHNTTMVGFNDALLELLDKLVGGGHDRQIIPIVGMGGMGKTTIASNAYAHPLIREHFDILAWVTVSQKHDAPSILSKILSEDKRIPSEMDEFLSQDEGNPSERNEKQLGEYLHKYLFGRRYLIIMDDVWSIKVWDRIKSFFPNNDNGSRIVVTTRLSNLARWLNNFFVLDMRFLNFDESWILFSKIVFPRDGYPVEMVEIGKKIVEKCRGLPLSIVLVGGFLTKSKYKREYWEYIEKNLSSVVNSDNDEHSLKILQMSYNQLPVHLKPCFLFMGLFKEDGEIRISKLVKLWIAEGFLKPINGKDLEEVAEEYLYNLVDRNLILIVKNKEKYVKVHNLLRDLCLRQAEVERFYSVVRQHNVSIPLNQRRFVISEASLEKEFGDVALLSMPLARSVMCYFKGEHPSPHLKLLRVRNDSLAIYRDYYFRENKFQLVNLRYLAAKFLPWNSKFATSLHLLWSLQTLIIQCSFGDGFTAPVEIWNMPQLRHVEVKGYVHVPDPPVCNGQDIIVLKNLQTFMIARNFKCGEEMVERIPNIKKLALEYIDHEVEESQLNNLDRLRKLKSFKCKSRWNSKPDGTDHFLHKLSFPRSLKKLDLHGSHFHWEDLLEKIGSLPLLQKLELNEGFFTMHAWETFEGQFPSLKSLKISHCSSMKYWNSECSHFPRLEYIGLHSLRELRNIPSDFGEIPMLKSIMVSYCSKSVVVSCKRIQEEHEELYGEEETVRVQVLLSDYEGLQDLVNPNFELIQ